MDYEYTFSSIVDPIATTGLGLQGLSEGIPFRMSHFSKLEAEGAARATRDWKKAVGSLPKDFNGACVAPYSWASCAVCECKPDRLELMSYALEFEFIYDDLAEESPGENAAELADARLQVFHEWNKTGKVPDHFSGTQGLQAQMIREMMTIDKESALAAINWLWPVYLEMGAGRRNDEKFNDFKEFLDYRLKDAGMLFMIMMLNYGMGLKIPEHEHELTFKLDRMAWVAAVLTNDLFSWERERRCHEVRGIPFQDVFNALPVLMRIHSIGITEAEELLRREIKEAVNKFRIVVSESIVRQDLSRDLRLYLEALQYTISGNLAWSLTCPRYKFALEEQIITDEQRG